jgi:uncharacterized protein (TIGR02452 family)
MSRSDYDQLSPPYTETTSLKQIKPTQVRSSPSTSSLRHVNVVYIPDLPSNMMDNLELEQLVRRRIEDILDAKLADVKCYLKLGIGVIHVTDDRLKDRLLNKIGKIALDPKDGTYFITFTDIIELVSYVVLDVTKERKDDGLPTTKEITRRWIELHKGCEPLSCDPLNAQFSNIYRIISTSLDELVHVPDNYVFKIKSFLAHIYYCADCSFFEDLPPSITQNQLREAITTAIGQSDISPTSLRIEVNKQAATACIIAADTARLWSTKTYISIDKNTLSKKTKLSCRLLIHPIPKSLTIQSVINHPEFKGSVTNHKHSGDHLILELSDKDVFENCLQRGALRINQHLVNMDLFNTLHNPEDIELDAVTWYETEMLQYKPDIMQFVTNPQHAIFRYKWNSKIWLEQFKSVASQKRDNNRTTSYDPQSPTPDQKRHNLRVTVMLNTLAAIRKRSYMIGDQEVKLNLKNELKTIVYDHKSKLERGEKMPLRKTPYSQTTVHVTREDCLLVYEQMAKNGKRPLLLNMASATSPGGGYRKGDGAQEENLFRRSDYCRSLDIGLDDFFQQRPERLHCSSDCQLEPMYVQNTMYPMDEYGAIYTSGITVFRQSEDTGYAFMQSPLENVCALAMAAYREPELKENTLAPKCAVGTRKKIENIFAIAYHHKHDSLVLSAFGCGAFKNPPDHIVKLFQSVIEQYAGFFESIVFAIIDDHNTGRQLNPEGNFRPFANVLEGLIVQPITPLNQPNTMIGPYRLLSNGSSVSDISIIDLIPCKYGAKCNSIYNPNHASQFSHPPLCIQAAVNGNCKLINDPVHMVSFIHRSQCPNGGECPQINDEKHNREFEHPDYCSDGGKCQNQKEEHLKQYRHLPLCGKSHKCMDYRKEVKEHCNKYRHCGIRCPYGNCCAMFHDKKHLDEFQHPFPTPCQRTPFDCPHYIDLTGSKNIQSLSMATQQHCLDFAHVCKFGRNCTDKTPLHWSKSIHVARHLCPYGDKCNKLNDEEHLNSFTHPNIPDIRPPCAFADECHDRRKDDHKVRYRHPMPSVDGVVQYYGSNEKTNFVQNQKDNIERVEEYITKQNWTPLPSGSIPQEIINWLRIVQPIHRCNPIIFESILLHGHVMSREYMEHLKDPKFVANSVLQHSQIRHIEALKIKTLEDDARQYVTALINLEFEKKGFSSSTSVPPTTIGSGASLPPTPYSSTEYYTNIIKKKENKLSGIMQSDDMNVLRSKAIEIAEASIKLHTDPAGIGYERDKILGTDKLVFSILGPHLGHYYGDVIIIFKREILHHPDANFSMQAATSFASGNAYHWRPWLDKDPGSTDERAKHYHRTKLHASIPGYDYAAALELMLIAGVRLKSKTMDINLKQILDQWVKVDSHQNIEAHLPQLIPLDYIDHIYIPKNLFDTLSDSARKAIDAVFKHRITVVPHDGEANHQKTPFGPTPTVKSRAEYQDFVIKELRNQYKQNTAHLLSKNIEGIMITIPSMAFDDHYVLPLTISQAYAQYRIQNTHPSKNNIVYIYWKAKHGDMMLTLSNEEIDPSEKQPNLRCLICYVAPKSTLNDNHYYEHTSYLTSGHPLQHEMIINKKTYKTNSNTFYIGCNTDDFITYCLAIHRSTGEANLSHAGSNAIYNHEEMSCVFNKSELDLSKLEFIHVSAGAHTVPIRNLMICFEKQSDLHPTFDKNFKKDDSSATENRLTSASTTNDRGSEQGAYRSPSPITKNDNTSNSLDIITKLKSFFFDVDDSPSERIPCKWGAQCYDYDTAHRAQYSHLPVTKPKEQTDDYRTPCKWGAQCHDDDANHQAQYSHPSDAKSQLYKDDHKNPYKWGAEKSDNDSYYSAKYPRHSDAKSQVQKDDHKIPCKWGAKCHDYDSNHRAHYSHPSTEKSQIQTNDHKIPCKWGAQCHDDDVKHRAQFSHPSTEKSQVQIYDHKIPCKWGAQCHDNNAKHRAQYYHPK